MNHDPVEYIARNGQLFKTESGRTFELKIAGGRIELICLGTRERFLIVEFRHMAEISAQLIHDIGKIAVGERLKEVHKIKGENDGLVE